MGAVLLLLIVPLAVFLLGELFTGFSWTLFGLTRTGARDTVRRKAGAPPARIVRQPDLPPRMALHERSGQRIVVDATGPGGEPWRYFLRA